MCVLPPVKMQLYLFSSLSLLSSDDRHVISIECDTGICNLTGGCSCSESSASLKSKLEFGQIGNVIVSLSLGVDSS